MHTGCLLVPLHFMQQNNKATLRSKCLVKLHRTTFAKLQMQLYTTQDCILCTALHFKMAQSKNNFLSFSCLSMFKIMCTRPRSLLFTLTLEHNETVQKAIKHILNQAMSRTRTFRANSAKALHQEVSSYNPG